MTNPLDSLNLTLEQKADILILHMEKMIPLDDAIHKIVKESQKAQDGKK